jgi:phosphoenolpyruvate-protein kinase (PTS system EI component)
LLVGLGVQRLSAHPKTIGRLRRVVREIDAGALREVADACCDVASAADVERLLDREDLTTPQEAAV